MRNSVPLLGAVLLTGLLASGCAGPEQKLGRGIDNTLEIVRLGETQRSLEQTTLFKSAEQGYTQGVVSGFTKSLARTGVGIYEIITFPIPSYDPIWTSYLTPRPAYPDSFKPGLLDTSTFATDTYIGFSGGQLLPFIPGSRFFVFDN